MTDSVVKNLPAKQGMGVQPLDQEHAREKEMATQARILAWGIPRQRSLVGYSPWGHKRVGHSLASKQQHILQ